MVFSKVKVALTLCCFVLAGFLLMQAASAQQTLGGIVGVVTDASGSILPDVSVKVVEEETHLTRTAQSNSAGSYAFPNLPIGTYTVTFTRDGFSTARFPGIVVQADRTVTLPAQMAVGSVTEAVTVEANPLMNAVDTTNGYVLDRAQIESAPLPTGSFTGLAILSTGVSAELSGGTGANSGLGNQPIWANGQRDTSNSFQLNGVDSSNLFNGKSTSQVASARIVNNTGVGNIGAGGTQQSSASVYLAIGQALPTPAPETIQEVRVNASMYDAQQGSTSGAHIDLSTSSGTNAYHGSGYFRRGTDWLNAAPFFFKQDDSIPANEKVPQLHRYNAGFTLGGPIIKDKLFGFIAYQHVHVSDQEIGISRLTVPPGLTDDRSAGTLAALANTNFGLTGDDAIQPSAVSPVALFLLNYKMPNGQYMIPSASGVTPTQNVPFNASIPGTAYFHADQAVADLDWIANSRNTVALKYYYQHDPLNAPYAYSNVPGFTQHLDAGSHVFSINNTTLLKPNLSVVQTIGFVRQKAYAVNDQPFGPSQAGISAFGSTYFPGISIVDVLGNGNANNQNPDGLYDQALNVGPGAFTQGPFTGLFQNRLMPSANATWTIGKHTFAFGGNYSYTQLNIRNQRTNKGMISTADFANFLEGNLSYQNNDFTTTTFLVGNANRYYRANQVGSYFQDKFQVKPNLSLTVGIRYDWNGGLTEKHGNIFNFDPSEYQFNTACLTNGDESSVDCYPNNGFVIASNNVQATPGASKTTLTGRQWGFGPRIGAAWQPKMFNSKLVVRAGTGIYYDRGELFTYLSPGYAAGEVTGGPFGVVQAPPFVNAVQCNPDDPQPTVASACEGPFSLSTPFGTSIPNQPTGKAADITHYLPTPAQIENGAQMFSFANYAQDNKLPYTINYTFDVQWQPRNNLAVEVGYVGNLGRHQVIPVPFNQAGIASASHHINGQIYTYGYAVQEAGNSFCFYNCAPANLPNGNPYLATYEGGNIDLRVPYLGYSAESETYKAAGISSYNALQVHVEQRMTHGFQIGFSYTYSHALDEQSGMGLFYNGNNPLSLRDGYASSDFDRTHVVNFTYLYQLPTFFPKTTIAGKITDGWTISGIAILQSGQPYSVIDYSGAVGSIYYGVADGITNPIVPLAPGCTPQNARTGVSGAFGAPALKADCFTLPLISPGGLGGAVPSNDPFETDFTSGQRNIFRQSAQKRTDLSIIKDMNINERMSLRYTFDIFNLTNTASFDVPKDNVSQNESYNGFPSLDQAGNFFNEPSGLGYVTSAIGSPRQIQMSLRLIF
ncbi:carboxypeptidase family protein [Edaphobacter aggregans]|uniref:Carboxypeptidase family protein n=2 Tax=Edaphobacter aggregans TaxID=570835 RepID=A0A3R9NVL7_9BACT|nr:carboxypeptidase family protein [Edaphobacter aggregans]